MLTERPKALAGAERVGSGGRGGAGSRRQVQQLARFLRATQRIGTRYWLKAFGALCWLEDGNFG
jgi:hypothetical protein